MRNFLPSSGDFRLENNVICFFGSDEYIDDSVNLNDQYFDSESIENDNENQYERVSKRQSNLGTTSYRPWQPFRIGGSILNRSGNGNGGTKKIYRVIMRPNNK